MADRKISELVSLTGANAATGDLLPIVDISATETKKITREEFFTSIPSIDVTGNIAVGGTVDGRDIAADGSIIDGLGTISTQDANSVNINGGTIDGTVIGGSTPAAITGTTGQFGTSLNVDGTVTADGLTVDNGVSSSIRIAGNGNNAVNTEYATLEFYNNDPSTAGPNVAASIKAVSAQSTGSGAHMVFGTTTGSEAEGTPAIERLRIHSGGDISFYEDTGTTPKFFWDASAESLGIGTSSPSDLLELSGNTAQPAIRLTDADVSGLYHRIFTPTNTGLAISADTGNVAANSFLRFDVDGSEAMRIDSSGNVGIGTSSPATHGLVDGLVIGDGTSNQGITLFGSTTSQQNIAFTDIAGDQRGLLQYEHSSDAMRFFTSATERMRITSTGNVGIGTSSPSALLHVEAADGAAGGAIKYTSTGVASGYMSADGAGLCLATDTAGITFRTGVTGNDPTDTGSERMRIDSSGHVLIGKTDVTFNTAGIALRAEDVLQVTRNAETPVEINRTGNDGKLIELYKDGTAVGSIGSRAGTVIYITSNGTNETGLDFGGTSVNPMLSGSLSNGTTDLGNPGNRFKDLYLSGGVYLGGTTSANLLDDYEEGTWTPTAIGTSGAATLSEASGSYTKVGRMVTVNAEIDVSSVNTASGIVRFGGLPFTVANIISPSGIEASGSVSYWTGFTSAVNSLTVYATDTSTIVDLTGNTSATATSVNNIGWTNMGTGEVRFSLTYFTT